MIIQLYKRFLHLMSVAKAYYPPAYDLAQNLCGETRLLRNPHKLPLAPYSKLLVLTASVSKLTPTAQRKTFAERRGFEPRKPFWGLHAFQACLFNHSSISPQFISICCHTNSNYMAKLNKNIEPTKFL